MKKTQKKQTKKTSRRSAKQPPRHGFVLDDLLDGLHEPIEMPAHIVLDLEHYDEMLKELASLRNRVAAAEKGRAADAAESRAAGHRYDVAIAALERANSQINFLKDAVSSLACSTSALSGAVRPAKIDRGQPVYNGASVDVCRNAPKGVSDVCRVADSDRIGRAEPTA